MRRWPEANPDAANETGPAFHPLIMRYQVDPRRTSRDEAFVGQLDRIEPCSLFIDTTCGMNAEDRST
ncbi:MAG TPA: hypothetical protein VMR62_18550 [Bryobacteraceae bacterium]|nr:hypothetical protein [Bryobacteraceae bacterium]